MNEVSCRAFRFFQACEGAGLLRIDDLLAGSALDRETLSDPSQRISWNEWAQLCDRCAKLLGSDEALERSGRLAMTSHMLDLGRSALVLGRLLTAHNLYSFTAKWLAPLMYRNLQFDLRGVGYRQIEMRITIPAPYCPCRSWMVISKGALASLPSLIGQPQAVLLEATITPWMGSFRLMLPANKRKGASLWRYSRRAIDALPADVALQLHKSEETNRILLEALPDLVLRMQRDGILLDVKAGRAHPQFDLLAQFVGQDVRVLTRAYPDAASEAVAQGLAAVDEAIALKTERLVDLRVVFADGRRDFECRIIPLDNEEVIAIVRDLTDRRRIERQLEIAERMASVGKLAAGVAHEINNPLTYVMGSIERASRLLESDQSDPQRAQRALHHALEGAMRVRDIVRNLTDSTSERQLPASAVDVQTVLDHAIDIAGADLGKVARVQRDYQPCPSVYVASSRLLQVFVNLLVNARQAIEEVGSSKSNGLVVVRTSRDAKGNAAIVIHDNGPGIAKDAIDHIFDPFFTTKEHRSGTGLGLWQCQRIVDDFGGTIAAENLPNGGACFTLVIPPVPATQKAAVEGEKRRVADSVIDIPAAP